MQQNTQNSSNKKKIMTLFESVTSANPSKSVDFIQKDEFDRMTKAGRDKAILDYLEEKWKGELHNRTSFIWLWEVYSGKWGDHTQGGQDKRRALEMKMMQFKKSIQMTKDPYKQLLLDFREYPFNNPQEQKVNWND